VALGGIAHRGRKIGRQDRGCSGGRGIADGGMDEVGVGVEARKSRERIFIYICTYSIGMY